MPQVKDLEVRGLSVEKLFSSDFYSVPAYQRDYVWEEMHVDQFFDDIFESFEGTLLAPKSPRRSGTYYLGNLVLARSTDDGETRISIVDGQQRMTTTFLLLRALVEVIRGNRTKGDDSSGFTQFEQTLLSLLRNFDTKTRTFLPRIEFLYPENQDFITRLMEGSQDEISSLHGDRLSRSQARLLDAYALLYDRVLGKLSTGTFSLEDLGKFLTYFLNNVIFSVVYAENLSAGLYIFQNLNDRGVGLAPSDLLKNLLLSYAADDRTVESKISRAWKELVETLEAGNRTNKTISIDRFVRHYLMARCNQPTLKLTEVFQFLTTEVASLGIEKAPYEFLNDMLERARKYVAFFKGTDLRGEEIEALENMRYLRLVHHLLPLMFTDNLPEKLFEDLCEKIENLLFVYSIVGKLTRDFESVFCQWSFELSKIKNEEGYQSFLRNQYYPEFKSQKKRFTENFEKLSQSGQTRYRQKYILAKLGQLIERTISGKDRASSRAALESNFKEIEHILPERPSSALREEFERSLGDGETYEEYAKMFGNLTLLDKPINVVASNRFFADKVKLYRSPHQNFKLTTLICDTGSLGKNTRLERTIKTLGITAFNNWDKAAILERQKQLTRIALHVWGFEQV